VSAGALVVFAKSPRPGGVKTRMCPPLRPEEAAELYACMLDDVLEASAAFAAHRGLEPVLAVHPPEAEREMAVRAPPGFRVIGQRGSGLAERMARAAAEMGAGGRAPILLRGSDSPALPPAALRAALDGLADADLVLVPDVDGGYNAVALRRPVEGLFDHAMSTGSVLQDTLRCARRLGLRTRVGEESFDLDTASDLALLARTRERSELPGCRRTLEFLDEARLWPSAGGEAPARLGGRA